MKIIKYGMLMMFVYKNLFDNVNYSEIKLVANRILFNKFDFVNNIYFLLDGDIKIINKLKNNEHFIIENCKSFKFISLNSIFFDKYEFSAIAYNPSTVISIDINLFKSNLKENPVLSNQVSLDLASQLNYTYKKIEILGERTVYQRIKKWMIFNDGCLKKGSYNIIAREIFVSKEALYKELKNFKF
jgi:CRP-like cAMP-binding protein